MANFQQRDPSTTLHDAYQRTHTVIDKKGIETALKPYHITLGQAKGKIPQQLRRIAADGVVFKYKADKAKVAGQTAMTAFATRHRNIHETVEQAMKRIFG